MKKLKFKNYLNFILCALSLFAIVGGSAAAYRSKTLFPQTDSISTTLARGNFGNINLMTEKELADLPGIGTTLAKRIIEYREENGGFNSPEEIKRVYGIGEGKFKKLENIIYTEKE